MTLADAQACLAGLYFVKFARPQGNGDLLILHVGLQGWTFADVRVVVYALGCERRIDVAAVVTRDDTLIVRGILTT